MRPEAWSLGTRALGPLVVRAIAPLAALLLEGWGAALGALLIQEFGLRLAIRVTQLCQRTSVERIFLGAYLLRVLLIVPTHSIAKLSDGNGALFRDDYTNDLVGSWMARIAGGEGISIFTGHQHLLEGLYPYLIMLLYGAFGFVPLLPKLLNAVIAALSAVLIFEIGRRAFSRPVALLAAVGVALIPSLVIWSIAALKEPMVLCAALVGLLCLQRVADLPTGSKRSLDAIVVLVAAVAVSLDLRATLALILLALLGLVLLARSRYRPHPWQLALSSLVLLILVVGALSLIRSRLSDRPLSGVAEDVVLQIRHRRAQEAASARSQIRPELDVGPASASSALPEAEAASDAAPFSIKDDIVDPLGFALLAPAPWQARTKMELGASLEMLLVWYGLLAASLLAWPPRDGQRLFVACLILYALGNWVVLAVSEGNLGNLVRHRLTLAPALLLLGTAGLEHLWQRLGRRWLPVRPRLIDPRPWRRMAA